MNFLEQLVYEYYHHLNYVVIRNKRVGYRKEGGWTGELDIVAYDPSTHEVIHIECSNDNNSWEVREKNFKRKLDIGKKFIPDLFPYAKDKIQLKQKVLLGKLDTATVKEVGGGEVVPLKVFLDDATECVRCSYLLKSDGNLIVPEQYTILRTLYYAVKYSSDLFNDA
ncbi:hypothetical protein [Vibrio parahaemolyticus]|uniref:hypothetical protein n=1 Tax=Vibrio parahaemolyticus TaxID=670 RepID=UPI00084B8BCA|nr:hypothetical protein [Vibrio parahaemolyticus]MDG3438661.1 hypothetical protein [Vibrio parahaemolyticus]ODX90821.1 hypothetical protein BBM92_06350 [Vibrio parahaemolyticus]ODY13746.1 hypothetical protein BBM15_10630 [Vibrio parahaemolyticus]